MKLDPRDFCRILASLVVLYGFLAVFPSLHHYTVWSFGFVLLADFCFLNGELKNIPN